MNTLIYLKKYKDIQVLAPVGTMEAFYAAIHNGADAIYVGGKKFSARAYASNFGFEELEVITTYAHFYGAKVYITLNTILKDKELDEVDEVLEHIRRIYIDGIIIQDMGLYTYIRENYPDLIIHASTQLNVHNSYDAMFLEEMNFDCMVLARELNYKEIEAIRKKVGIHLETFIHGALCYSYSGQCYQSILHGNRSGNRGTCAQPCRHWYKGKKDGYLLSLKDQKSVSQISHIIEAGVDVLKIEGRMKNEIYVGLATKTYVNAVHYQDESIQNTEKKLDYVFNRGTFTSYYTQGETKKNMVSLTTSKNIGENIGKVILQKNEIILHTSKVILQGECIEIERNDGERYSFIASKEYTKGKNILIFRKQEKQKIQKFLKESSKNKGYRITNLTIEKEQKERNKIAPKMKISLKVKAKALEVFEVTAMLIEYPLVKIRKKGAKIEHATAKALDESIFGEKLGKLGNTPYVLAEIEIEMDEQIFMPISQINQMKKEIVAGLTERIEEVYREKLEQRREQQRAKVMQSKKVHKLTCQENEKNLLGDDTQHEQIQKISYQEQYSILVSDVKQYKNIVNIMEDKQYIKIAKNLLLYVEVTNLSRKQLEEMQFLLKTKKKNKVYIALPHIIKEDKWGFLEEQLHAIGRENIDGFLVRSLGQIKYIEKYKKPYVTDYNLHVMNQRAKKYYEEIGASLTTFSMELQKEELDEIQGCGEIVVYSHIASMKTANCLQTTMYGHCDKKDEGKWLAIKDRKDERIQVKCNCNYCYNTVYSFAPFSIHDVLSDKTRKKHRKRIEFTFETKEDMIKVIDAIQKNSPLNIASYLRGPYMNGVM